jgi:phosphoserine phosphatase
VDVGDGLEPKGEPLRHRTALGGVEGAVKAVRDPRQRRCVGPRRQDAQIPIQLNAVGVDDDAVERLGQRQRQRRFAARRRPGDDDDWRILARIAGDGVGRVMELVLTLIAGGAEAALSGLATSLARALSATPDWLAPGRACDLRVEAESPERIEALAREAIGAHPVDVLVQPVAGRRKRLLVADFEATIIANEMINELAELHGIGPQIAAITRRAMNGEIDFIGALQARINLLAGMDAAHLEAAASRIRLTPGARELVATMQRDGAITALVSGGFTFFAERVAADLGFRRVIANRMDLVEGRLAGTIRRPIVTGETKLQMLRGLAGEFEVADEETMAVGDGANDLAMIQAAGIGVAYHAKPAVAAAARWRLDHADLTGLLYAQGYRVDEIVR